MFSLMPRIIQSLGLLLALVAMPLQAQLDDPTRPPDFSQAVTVDETTGAGGTSWDLVSILVSPQRRIAIINGKTVHVGDTLSGAQVLDINTSGVMLRHQGEVVKLKLVPISVKRTPVKE